MSHHPRPPYPLQSFPCLPGPFENLHLKRTDSPKVGSEQQSAGLEGRAGKELQTDLETYQSFLRPFIWFIYQSWKEAMVRIITPILQMNQWGSERLNETQRDSVHTVTELVNGTLPRNKLPNSRTFVPSPLPSSHNRMTLGWGVYPQGPHPPYPATPHYPSLTTLPRSTTPSYACQNKLILICSLNTNSCKNLKEPTKPHNRYRKYLRLHGSVPGGMMARQRSCTGKIQIIQKSLNHIHGCIRA